MTDRSRYPVRKGTLTEEPRDETLAHLSPSARIARAWLADFEKRNRK